MIIPAKVAYAIGALVTTFLMTTQGVVDDVFSSVFRIRLPGSLRMFGGPLRISLGLFKRPRPILSPPAISSPISHVLLAAPTLPPMSVNIAPVQSMTMDLVPYPTTALAICNPDPLATAVAIKAPASQVTQVFSAKVGQVTSIVPRSYPASVLAPPSKTYPAADALAVFSFLAIIWTLYILIEFVRKGRRNNTRVTADKEINSVLRIRTPPPSFYVFTSPSSLWDSMAVGCSESGIASINDSLDVDTKLSASSPPLPPSTLASMSQLPITSRSRTHSTSLVLAALASSVRVKGLRPLSETTTSSSVEVPPTLLPPSVSVTPDMPQTIICSPASTMASPTLSFLGLGISFDDGLRMDLYHGFDDISNFGPLSPEDYIPSVVLEDVLPALSPELPDEIIRVLPDPMLLTISPSVLRFTSLRSSGGASSYLIELSPAGSFQDELDAASDFSDVKSQVAPCPEEDDYDPIATLKSRDHSLLDDCLSDTATLDLAYPVLVAVDSALDVLVHVTTPTVLFTAASSSDIAVPSTRALADTRPPGEDGPSPTSFRGPTEPDNTPLVNIPVTPMVSSPSLGYLADDFTSSMDALAESLSEMSLGPISDAPRAEYPLPVYWAMQDEKPTEKPKKRLVGLGIFPEVTFPFGSVESEAGIVYEYSQEDLLFSNRVVEIVPCMVPLPVSVPSSLGLEAASTQAAASGESNPASIPLPDSPSPASYVADPANTPLPALPVMEMTTVDPASIPLALSPMLAFAYADPMSIPLPDSPVLPASVGALSISPPPSPHADAASVPLPPPSLDLTTVPILPLPYVNPTSTPLPYSLVSAFGVIEPVSWSLPDLLLLDPSIVDPAAIHLPPSPLPVDPAFISLPPPPLLAGNPLDPVLTPLPPSPLIGFVHVDPVSVPLPPSPVVDSISIPLLLSPLLGLVDVESLSVPLPLHPSPIVDSITTPLSPSPCIDLMSTPIALLPSVDPASIPLPPSPYLDPTFVSLPPSPSSAFEVIDPASIPLPDSPLLVSTGVDPADIPLPPSPDVDPTYIPVRLSPYLSAPYIGSPAIMATVYGLGVHLDPGAPEASPAADYDIDDFATTATDATYLFATYTISVKMPVTIDAMSVFSSSDVSLDLIPFPADFATTLLDDSSTTSLTATPVVPSLSSSALSPAQVSVDIGLRTAVEGLWKPPLLTSLSQSSTKIDVKIDIDAESLPVIVDVPCIDKENIPLSRTAMIAASMTFSDSNLLHEHEDKKEWTVVTRCRDRVASPSFAPSSVFSSPSFPSTFDEDSFEVPSVDKWSWLDDDVFAHYSFSSELIPLGPAPAPPAFAISSITRSWDPVSSTPTPPWVQHIELFVDMITPSKSAHARVLPPLPHDHRPAGPAVDVNGADGGRPRRKRTRRGQGKKRQEAALKTSVRTAGMVDEYHGGVQKGVPGKNVIIGRRAHLVRRQQRTQRVHQPPNDLALWTIYEEPPSQDDGAVACADGPQRLGCNDGPRASSLGLSRLVTLNELIDVIATPKAPRKPHRSH